MYLGIGSVFKNSNAYISEKTDLYNIYLEEIRDHVKGIYMMVQPWYFLWICGWFGYISQGKVNRSLTSPFFIFFHPPPMLLLARKAAMGVASQQ
jgi:hypothetical protein